jgi:hypothetical protein
MAENKENPSEDKVEAEAAAEAAETAAEVNEQSVDAAPEAAPEQPSGDVAPEAEVAPETEAKPEEPEPRLRRARRKPRLCPNRRPHPSNGPSELVPAVTFLAATVASVR